MTQSEFQDAAEARDEVVRAWNRALIEGRAIGGTSHPPGHPPPEFTTAFAIGKLNDRITKLEERLAKLEPDPPPKPSDRPTFG